MGILRNGGLILFMFLVNEINSEEDIEKVFEPGCHQGQGAHSTDGWVRKLQTEDNRGDKHLLKGWLQPVNVNRHLTMYSLM